jgi:hypothetical protein
MYTHKLNGGDLSNVNEDQAVETYTLKMQKGQNTIRMHCGIWIGMHTFSGNIFMKVL